MLGWAYALKRKYPEGIAEFQRAQALFGSPTSQLHGLIYAYGMSGNKTEALRVLAELKKLTKQHHPQIPWVNWVLIHIGIGEHDEAFEVLEKHTVKVKTLGLSLIPLIQIPFARTRAFKICSAASASQSDRDPGSRRVQWRKPDPCYCEHSALLCHD